MNIGYILGYLLSVGMSYGVLFALAALLFNTANKRMGKTFHLKIKYVFVSVFVVVALTCLGSKIPLTRDTGMFLGGISLITICLSFLYFIASLFVRKD